MRENFIHCVLGLSRCFYWKHWENCFVGTKSDSCRFKAWREKTSWYACLLSSWENDFKGHKIIQMRLFVSCWCEMDTKSFKANIFELREQQSFRKGFNVHKFSQRSYFPMEILLSLNYIACFLMKLLRSDSADSLENVRFKWRLGGARVKSIRFFYELYRGVGTLEWSVA